MNYKDYDEINTDADYKNNNEENFTDNIELFLRNLDISLANLEKVGAIFVTLGYSTFLCGADLDISEALGINNSDVVPISIFLFGQQLILIGFNLLFN
ncbi:hypothetical protein [uncultured Clostridium sp.]|uniref:hypothetical protein n=1 Tax=uncultured Clostridium sp. TaxID=59620 RepID=UPI0028E8C9EC|nr:hypothetical protein [uncultured Clostridium sp.]